MTDEEIEKVASEKADKKYPVPYLFIDLDIASNRSYKQGFIEGVKYGCNMANEWHDLRKNPDDLPKKDERFLANVSISVMTQKNIFACYYFDEKRWYSHGLLINSPIAWHEIPIFERETNGNTED